MNYTLSNVKTFNGRQGQGFSATLSLDGRKVADVIDEANGGCSRFYWLAKDRTQANADERTLTEYVATLPPTMFDGEPLTMDIDLFVSNLVEDINVARQFARWSKNSIVFSVGRDIRRTKAGYTATPERIAALMAKYPSAKVLNGMPTAEAVEILKAAAQ